MRDATRIGDKSVELEELYTSLKPKLLGIAYHMVGSLTDAEDFVHDVFATLQGADTSHVRQNEAYAVQMLVNRCRNHLASATRRREVYVGPWLPEPIVEAGRQTNGWADSLDFDPLILLEQGESVSYAVLVLLEQLSPVERTVFVLREVFDYDYDEISRFVSKSAVNCRKILSRATAKVRQSRGVLQNDEMKHLQHEWVKKFMRGASTGDFREFIHSLSEDVQLMSDGGGKTTAAMRPIDGVDKIARFLLGLHRKGALFAEHAEAKVNGDPGLLLYKRQQLHGVICFDGEGEKLTRIYLIVNPDKLSFITYQGSRP